MNLVTRVIVVSCVVGGARATYDLENLDEGQCSYFKRVKHLNRKWMTDQGEKGWYLPMLSGQNANAWTLTLTGKPLKSESELVGMCLMLYVKGNVITATGYGHKAVFNCTMMVGENGKQKKECHPTEESSFPEFAQQAVDSTMSVSLTDNMEYLVSIRCLHGQKIWALISSSPVVEERAERRILSHVRQLGFDSAKAVKLNYNNCTAIYELKGT